MGSFIHHDIIAERLEMARTMGLLTNYLVSPVGPEHRPAAGVKVWRSATASDAALQDYLARLLEGFVDRHEIVVVPPFPLSQAPEAATKEPGIDALGAPVPAAAA